MQAKGHDVTDHAKEEKNFKIFRQRGAYFENDLSESSLKGREHPHCPG